ncbi:TIGR03032 family protein [Anatilimnocola sp. NA78]|uniref:TIGR03032 family protein n=1 Tax=Anatilimnocola sp. NA78 TaxID=3415683 RepID=UPI003CE4C1E4
MAVHSEVPRTGRRISYSASDGFVPLLEGSESSLLLSTYHAGKLVTICANQGQLALEFHNFELAMGIAIHPLRLAVGARHDVWMLEAVPNIAATIEPRGKYDACLLTRRSIHTGTIHGHEMAYLGDELWIVNTLFSCLCTLDERHHFVPRWKPKFISAIQGPDDRCHLNGMAVSADGQRVQYVTAMGATDSRQGWRDNKASGGIVIDVASGEIVSHGLCMPHSPRLHEGRLWVLNSGCGELQIVDPSSGLRTTVERFPGYTRGLSFLGPLAFVGLSRIRETAVFGGVPIAEMREELRCGIAVVDLRVGRTVATLQFTEGMEEVFALQSLPGVRCPAIRGPHLPQDGHEPIWVVPPLP